MLRDMLTLKNAISVSRVIETSDGMGGTISITSITTLSNAALWSPGQFARYISDKVARTSTHILATEPSEYTFTVNDKYVTYNGNTYKINGPSDDVMNLGELLITPLERSE